MTISSLEQDLQEVKQAKIEELTNYNTQLIKELEEDFQNQKEEFEKKVSTQLQNSKLEYSNYNLNAAKKEAKTLILKSKQEKAGELVESILEILQNDFSNISKEIIKQAIEVLNSKEKDITIVVNKEHQKAFEKIVDKKQITTQNIKLYTFECHFNSELVRFDLKEFISAIVQEEVSKE